MAKSENQKQKILVLLDLFKSKTDEEHGVTTSDIIDYLAEHGIKAERKTVYAMLCQIVYNIRCCYTMFLI